MASFKFARFFCEIALTGEARRAKSSALAPARPGAGVSRGPPPSCHDAGMLLAALVAAFHFLALALGMSSVVARGLRLRDLRRNPQGPGVLQGVLVADTFWGIAAALWLVTGLARAFGHLEKAPDFYRRNGFFHLKMALFVSVIALEIVPIVTLTRWRIAKKRGEAPWLEAPVDRLVRINDTEVVGVALIIFVATLMARGVWLF